MNASMTNIRPDLEEIKSKQRVMWGSGDYGSVAAHIVYMSERMAEDLDLSAGQRVLDVATGTGNAAIASARRGAHVVGIDFQETLLAWAERRAEAEHVEIELIVADAENLPFEDKFFDVVTSVVGVMFAPNQEKAASELVRVCKSDGKIVSLSWTPEGFVGALLKTVGAFVSPPPGVKPSVRWGTKQGMQELLGSTCNLSFASHNQVFRFESADALATLFIEKYGPTERAWSSLDSAGRQDFFEAISGLATKWNEATDGTIRIAAEYLKTIARPV